MRPLRTRQLSLFFVTLAVLVLGAVAKTARDISIDQLAFGVGTDGKEKTREVLSYPKTLSKTHTVGLADDLVVAVRILDHKDEPTKVRQVVLSLKSEETDKEAAFVLSPDAENIYQLTLPLKASTTLETLSYQPGKYQLSLYIGSSKHTPIEYSFGGVELDFPKDPKFGKFEHDVFEPLPEIVHQFRPDEKQPPVILSQLFVILVLAPWGFLAVAYLHLNANINNFFASSSNTLFGSLFLGSLASLLTLLYLYWLKLNIFQLLGYGSVLSLATAVLGRQALVARAAYRTKANK
ncbi:proteasome regulatory particle base subunit [Rhizophlyctis rosea]|uniref:Ribophorin II n=1 Tax=Rhizophlyctis rosea TaxID=64517 RepID=A0AAD5SM75_9FUNG|nr:proteasome regulatory particle base subunit [Rhizophlyctis rosea]